MHLAEIFQEAELPDGVVNIVTGARRNRPGAGRARRHQQDRFHRFDRRRQDADPEPSPGRRRSSRSSSAARRPISSSKTRRSTRPSKASSPGSISIKATSAARARVCSCRKEFSRPSSGSCAIASRRLRVGNPLDKNTDIGAINSRMQLDKIRELVDSGLQQGAELVQPRCVCRRRAIGIRPAFLPA